MTTEKIAVIQDNLGIEADGIAGPDTARYMKEYLKGRGITADVAGFGSSVVASITGITQTKAEVERVARRIDQVDTRYNQETDWMYHARSVLGRHERVHNKSLMDWLRSDGPTLGDPSKLPWCGDFVQTCLNLSGNKVDIENPYLARNWLNFGIGCSPLNFGSILVFWRGSKSGTKGHVGFCVGYDPDHYHVLGGNQSNSVSVARISKDRLLGARWPTGVRAFWPKPFTVTPGKTTVNEA